MNKVTIVVRVIFGFIFAGAGIAFFFTPMQIPEGAMGTFLSGLIASHYFLYLLKITETVCGLLLMSGMFVPLALVVLAPVVLNIFFVHVFLAPAPFQLGFALLLGIFEIYLSFFSAQYSPKIRQLFQRK